MVTRKRTQKGRGCVRGAHGFQVTEPRLRALRLLGSSGISPRTSPHTMCDSISTDPVEKPRPQLGSRLPAPSYVTRQLRALLFQRHQNNARTKTPENTEKGWWVPQGPMRGRRGPVFLRGVRATPTTTHETATEQQGRGHEGYVVSLGGKAVADGEADSHGINHASRRDADVPRRWCWSSHLCVREAAQRRRQRGLRTVAAVPQALLRPRRPLSTGRLVLAQAPRALPS